MAHPRKYTTEEMKKFVMDYTSQYPGESVTAAKVGRYLREVRNIDIGDYLLRRDKDVSALMKDLNTKTDEDTEVTVATFHPLDVELFLQTNSSRDKLKAALTARDEYYAKLTRTAGRVFDDNKSLEKELNTYKSKVSTLTQKLKEAEEQSERKANKEYEKKIQKLIALMKEYVYPDVANSLLEKAGLLDLKSSLTDTEKLEGNAVHIDTEIIDTADAEEAAKEATDNVPDETGDDGNGEGMNGAVSDLLKGFD